MQLELPLKLNLYYNSINFLIKGAHVFSFAKVIKNNMLLLLGDKLILHLAFRTAIHSHLTFHILLYIS